ncbi:MAG: YraN family protein [Deltaproteobacteria bacterium]|nr:YraN family protein [Deltaproteobacteria bacterium]
MTRARRQTGIFGEERAAAVLREAGYRLLARNYRCPQGEVDIVAEEGEQIVFVEVKARRGEAFGGPAAAVTRAKRRRIARAALHYLAANRMLERPARFDVVTLLETPSGWRIEILRNAFEIEG